MERINVGILGATGMVGQRFIVQLQDHPWFNVTELAASDRSAGKSYIEAVKDRWKLDVPVPETAASMNVKPCTPGLNCKIIFSALDSGVAGPIEESFAKAGYWVFSNARNHRMDRDVPLLVPEVNHDHLQVLDLQESRFNGKGRIITNPNCSTIGLVMALGPIHKAFGITKATVTTLQALSGAGYPGVSSLDIIDNVIPFISGEEGKMETEPLKILGGFADGRFIDADIKISATCNRVNVVDGHLECISVAFSTKPQPEQLVETWQSFNPLKQYNLPSSPRQPVVVVSDEKRPQPRLDRMEGKGMSCVVGRIRPCNLFDYKFTILSHNTIRGAAGASVLNAELAVAKGLIQ